MNRLIFVLLLAAFVAAQIPEGCVDCGLPDHPNCQVCSFSQSGTLMLEPQFFISNILERNIPDHPNRQVCSPTLCHIHITRSSIYKRLFCIRLRTWIVYHNSNHLQYFKFGDCTKTCGWCRDAPPKLPAGVGDQVTMVSRVISMMVMEAMAIGHFHTLCDDDRSGDHDDYALFAPMLFL